MFIKQNEFLTPLFGSVRKSKLTMDQKVILRENIKFLVKAGDSREEVNAKIKNPYGTKAPCDATIYK